MTKYIFVTGGVVSSLGKGITAASLGALLKNRGLKVTIQKFDPYINYDPGTMNPYQHGEVFVTEDGAETDLDLGHYERFIDINLTGENNVTSGKIYSTVMERERDGYYQGETVQVIPHITDEIKNRIKGLSQNGAYQAVITEVGGTVGDIESLPFLEAIRQMKTEIGAENVLYLHVTLVPRLPATEELKTKPTQHSVKELRSIGIHPDLIICRTEHPLPLSLKEKIALFADVRPEEVIENRTSRFIYEVPLLLHKYEMDQLVTDKLNLNTPPAQIEPWEKKTYQMHHPQREATIGIVGKYVALKDAYISIKESLGHAGVFHNASIKTEMIDAEKLETTSEEYQEAYHTLHKMDGVIIAGGFGDRGIEGKINTVRLAREKGMPFLGLCLGMQCAVIEYARNVAGLKDAHSTEFDSHTPHPVIHLLPGQEETTRRGGTLRLGAYPCRIHPETRAAQAYGVKNIYERHRHRYEFNNAYREYLNDRGMAFSGVYPHQDLVEIIEIPKHPWFVGVQFHPEFKSRLARPHPLFRDFLAHALKNNTYSDQ